MKTVLLAVLGLLAVDPAPARAGNPTFSGGDGSTEEKAVIIKNATEDTGVAAEYSYLSQHFPGYHMDEQAVMTDKGRSFDLLKITTAKREKKSLYFDITSFYGKP